MAVLAVGGATTRLGPCVQSADLLFSAIHDFTNFNGSHSWTGGQHRDTNISEDICGIVSRVLRLLHTTFILLKPLSHSAVLTGIVFTQFNKTRTQGAIAFPREPLYSLNANYKSRNAKPNLVHNNRISLSPYSGDRSSGKLAGFSASIALTKSFSLSGNNRAATESARAW